VARTACSPICASGRRGPGEGSREGYGLRAASASSWRSRPTAGVARSISRRPRAPVGLSRASTLTGRRTWTDRPGCGPWRRSHPFDDGLIRRSQPGSRE
jgi:hypothetical protein